MLKHLFTNKKVVIIFIVFLLGLYYVSRYGSLEGFEQKNNSFKKNWKIFDNDFRGINKT